MIVPVVFKNQPKIYKNLRQSKLRFSFPRLPWRKHHAALQLFRRILLKLKTQRQHELVALGFQAHQLLGGSVRSIWKVVPVGQEAAEGKVHEKSLPPDTGA